MWDKQATRICGPNCGRLLKVQIQNAIATPVVWLVCLAGEVKGTSPQTMKQVLE